jgi:hypothetical protein
MDLIKQYIIQTISSAANNLRLSSEKIEVVTMLREVIANSDNVEDDLKQMKKITELSTLGIRLHRTYSFLMEEKIDFAKLSETFKEQSKWLVNDLSHLLDNETPQSFKEILNKTLRKEEIEIKEEPQAAEKEISIDLSRRDSKEEDFEFVVVDKTAEEKQSVPEQKDENQVQNNTKDEQEKSSKTKEKDEPSFEDIILKTVNSVDSFLQDITNSKIDKNNIEPYLLKLEENQKLSLNHNLYLVAQMHSILFDCLSFIKGKVYPVKEELIDYMRGCLIVIAAIIRRKDVDISNYLNKAEILAAEIRKIKEKELVK